MAHQLHLKKEKYRQWVKAGLGLRYLKQGLEPFCEDIADQQHKDILEQIKQTKGLSTATCGHCTLRTLKPDHVKIGNKQCPLYQVNCNCCFTNGKIACPNNVCGAIYDNIVTNHASTPPAPYWKNTDTTQWTVDPWSIAKCYINAPGYEQKSSAADTDCTGLLHVIINNKYFHNHIGCNITGADVFSKVRRYRNEIFHSSTMELDEAVANAYIDDMIAVLQDVKELINRTDAQDAVKKLLELKNEDFIMTTENMEKVLGDIREELGSMRKATEGLATKDDCEDLKKKFSALESLMSEQTEEMKRLKTDNTAQQQQADYERSKKDFQKELIDLYRSSFLQVSAIPLQPERNHCSFSEVYVRPRMTCDTKDENGRPKETEIQSMSDILTKAGTPLKSVYVLGDAGSGKSSFCRSLVDYWCLAHCEEHIGEDELDGVKEMKKFEFLFYISLRRCKDIDSIKGMLEKQYKRPILNAILNKESARIIIVLDGLDEWSPHMVHSNQFQTKGLPKRDTFKNYTVITTSRPWKIETLGVNDNEIERRIKLRGFDKSSVKKIIDKTVPILNKSFQENKSSDACKDKLLKSKSMSSMREVPIMLLQLTCLWFEDKLDETSRCAIYSGMLELFFIWNDKKKTDIDLFTKIREMSQDLQKIEPPQYLIDNRICKPYTYLIHDMSRLAYEALFTHIKEASLTFDSSTFEELGISTEVRTCCLKLGILSEDKCPSLPVSTCQSSLLSFIHKSVQEYLAAVYIAIKFKAHIAPSADLENANSSGHFARRIQRLFCQCATTADVYDGDSSDNCEQFVKSVFSRCTTLDEILEQANVFTMLCGLEPRLATSISKYIYDIVTRDKRVLDYRRTIDDNYRHEGLKVNIQRCTLNCIKEVQSTRTDIRSSFYLGDIVLDYKSDYEQGCTIIDNQYIPPDTVMSFRNDISLAKEYVKRVLKCLQKCRRLEAIYIDCSYHSDQIDDEDIKSVCDTIDGNTSTLKALSVDCDNNAKLKPVCKTIVRRLSDMSHLVALQIKRLTMTHEDFTSLCTFLSGTSQLEQLSIFDVQSECRSQHEVDLSKHQQLQYLKYNKHVCVTCVNTSNLEIYDCRSLYSMSCVKVLDSLRTASKLTELVLWYDGDDDLDIPPFYQTVTDKMVTLLQVLHQLRELHLENFTFTDNIIKFPSEMKSMKSISLELVTMSVTTWRKFVDSVPGMPLPVEVRTFNMYITRDGEEYDPFILKIRKTGEGAAAWQYVREQKALFNVESDFRFSTKK